MATIIPPAPVLSARPSGPSGQRRSLRTCHRGIDWRYLLYFYLHLAGFLGTTFLMSWGLFVLVFLAIGGFSVDGMMHHLNNLTSRYVAADASRVAGFRDIILVAHLILTASLIFFRRHSILPARISDRSTNHDQAS